MVVAVCAWCCVGEGSKAERAGGKNAFVEPVDELKLQNAFFFFILAFLLFV